jgi:cytochrome bd-type quinol oxidase subunit 2
MRSVRRLPPVLRALWVLGLLTSLAALGVLTWTTLAARGADQSGASRGWNRGMALFMALFLLSMACSTTLAAYNRRFEHPPRRALWPDEWQTQLKVVLALAALPLGMLVFALLIPSRSSLFQVVYALGVLSPLVLLVGWIRVADRSHG